MSNEKRRKSKRQIRELDFPPLSVRYDVNLLDNISCLSQPLSHPRLHLYYLSPFEYVPFLHSHEYKWESFRCFFLIFPPHLNYYLSIVHSTIIYLNILFRNYFAILFIKGLLILIIIIIIIFSNPLTVRGTYPVHEKSSLLFIRAFIPISIWDNGSQI